MEKRIASAVADLLACSCHAHNGTMKVSRLPLPEMPAELKQIIEEQKQ